MDDEPATVGQKYGLRRENFILDPLKDTACFARHDIMPPQAIAESLDIDLVTDLAPKRLVWGLYGGGKTHTLMRTMEELKKLTSIHSVRVECPDLSKRSRFHDLYRQGIMRALGQDFVVGLIADTVQSVPPGRREEYLSRLKSKFGDEEVAKAAIRISDPNFELRLWRWVSGVSMSRQDLDDLGQTQDLTEAEAARLADLICLFGRLLRELRHQTLVLVLDEMERLQSIGPETITTFVSGFTRLVDPNQNHVSVLIGASAAIESEMVEVFGTSGAVISRLGPEAQIEIGPLHEADLNKFIKEVIEFVRDPNVKTADLVSEAEKSCKETVKKEFFPFTEEAIEALKSHLTQSMTPREITMKMTRALGRAHRANKLAITSDCIA